MRVAGSHIAFRFNNARCQQFFLLIGKHAIAAILHRLAAPPWADFMHYGFILRADGEPGAGAVGEIVYLFLNPADGIFREEGGGAHLACLIADNQLVMLDPEGAVRQVVRQRERAAYRQRFILMLLVHGGIVLRALGTNRWTHDLHQRRFVGFDALGKKSEIELSHDGYPLIHAVSPFWRA